MLFEVRHRFVRHLAGREAMLPAHQAKEVLEQQSDVFATRPQRRNHQVHDVQTIVEIFAELLFTRPLEQIAVGRGDHAHVDDGVLALGTDLLDFAALEEPEQQGLHAQAHLAHFVEEHRPAVGHFEQSPAIAMGVGEAAAEMPEQLGLEQRFGHPAAIDGDQRPAAPRAALVNQPREQFLADTALAGDQHLAVAGSDLLRFFHQVGDESTSAQK